jgi:hypothetical protein
MVACPPTIAVMSPSETIAHHRRPCGPRDGTPTNFIIAIAI